MTTSTDAVLVDRDELQQLRHEAHCWRAFGLRAHRHLALCNVERDRDHWHWLRELAEDAREIAAGAWSTHDEAEWRRRLREASWSVSAALDWRNAALRFTPFADLEQIRAAPAWVQVCAHPGCRRMETRSTQDPWTCPSHRETGQIAA